MTCFSIHEGHPFWQSDVGLFCLFGFIECEHGEWRYRAFWAHDRAEEGTATERLVEYLAGCPVEAPEWVAVR